MLISELYLLRQKLLEHQENSNPDALQMVIQKLSNEIFMQELHAKVELIRDGILPISMNELCKEVLGVDDDTIQRIKEEN